MSAPPFDRLVTPAAFGAMLNPPLGYRSIYRWMDQPDGLPVTETPRGKRINLDTAWAWLKAREHQRVPRRQGRRANSNSPAEAEAAA